MMAFSGVIRGENSTLEQISFRVGEEIVPNLKSILFK